MWHVDATYKLTWQGYPVFVIDVTDGAKHFHPTAWAFTSNEDFQDFEFIL